MVSAPRTRVREIAAVLMLVLASASSTASSLRTWRDGPAGALLTQDEYRQFGELSTEAARRNFIERFWMSVERNTGGTGSDFRRTFERRCEAANARFEFAGQEGWRTDRGRVFLALGEPSSSRREPGDVNAIEKEVWTYGASGQGPESTFRVVFYRCTDGGYRIDPRCSIGHDSSSVAFDGERAEQIRRIRELDHMGALGHQLSMLEALLAPVPSGASSPARLETSKGRDGALPKVSAVLSRPASAHSLDDSVFFFRAADGTVLTFLTLKLLPTEDGTAGTMPSYAGPYLGAVTIEELPDAPSRTVALDTVAKTGNSERASFFGRVQLKAGRRYAARYAVRDGTRDEVFVRKTMIGVPDLSSGFSVSSIVPAERFGPAGPGSGVFQVGSEEVVPQPGGAFSRSELLRLYLQVYDAAIDPDTSRARIDVVFRFFRTGNGASKRYGKPCSVRGASGASMGLALPIGDWPAGSYRVEVTLHDRVAERRTTAEGRFSIVAD